MTYTLLEIVQLILSAMDSDEVNALDDTVESWQVANLVKSVYYDLAVDIGLPEHETLFELIASGDAEKPCLMTLPDGVLRLDWIKYNIQEADETVSNYRDVTFLPFASFLEMQQAIRENDDTGSQTFQSNGENFEIIYRSDIPPTYYTQVGNHTLLFDAYDSTLDSTLQKSKTMCHGVVYPAFELDNTFTPDLEPQHFSLLINRAKVRAFAELKQAPNQEAAAETRRQKVIAQKRKRTINDGPEMFKVARFGRK